ncbi:MAG: DUF4163 domain-containing protein [Acidobacteria bacterium]|nr:DUF4163 domain-containing protein [Acidobacteriota bacterium]
MNKNKHLTFLVILLLTLASISCGDINWSEKNKSDTNSSKPDTNISNESKIANAPVPETFSKTLFGKIGTYEITMNLIREKKELTGDYGYDNKIQTFILSGTDGLSLKGNITEDNTFILKEIETILKDGDFKEKVTGIFSGKIIAEQRNNITVIKLNGDWLNADETKKLNFFLTEQRFSLGDNIKILDKELREDNKKNNFEFNAVYPQFEGSEEAEVVKLNQKITNTIEKMYREFKKNALDLGEEEDSNESVGGSYSDIVYSFDLVNKDMVSIRFSLNDYYAGTAHPNSQVINFNYGIKANKELQLEDLFLKDSNYVSKINSLCQKASKGKDYEIFFNDENPKENLANWTVSPKGIFFHFGVAHVFGDIATIFIPYKEISDLIDPNSPISSFVK